MLLLVAVAALAGRPELATTSIAEVPQQALRSSRKTPLCSLITFSHVFAAAGAHGKLDHFHAGGGREEKGEREVAGGDKGAKSAKKVKGGW